MRVLIYGFQRDYYKYSWWWIFRQGLEEWQQLTGNQYKIIEAPYSVRFSRVEEIIESQVKEEILQYKPNLIVLVWKQCYAIFDILKFIKTQLGKCKVVQWHCDHTPLDERYGKHYQPEGIIDHLFISNSGQIEHYKKLGIPQVSFLPQAGIRLTSMPVKPKKEYECDIGFIGQANLQGESPRWYSRRTELLNYLVSEGYNIKFFPPLDLQKKYNENRKKYTEDLPSIIASCKITIQAMSDQCHNTLHYSSNRLYYALSLGSCFLCWNFSGLTDVFDPEIHLDTFNNVIQAKEKIDYYLNDNITRNQLRDQAFSYAQQKHLFIHRWQDLIESVEIEKGVFSGWRD